MVRKWDGPQPCRPDLVLACIAPSLVVGAASYRTGAHSPSAFLAGSLAPWRATAGPSGIRSAPATTT
jgi:hypothetical protein